MKKFLTLLGFLIILGMSSCTKEYYDVVPSQTFRYDVSPNQWIRPDGAANQIYADIDLPELTDYYVDQGIVAIAVSYDNDATYEILPATIDGVSFSVNYTTGSVRIYAQDPIMETGVTVDIPDKTLIVKITLTDADLIP